MRQIILEMLLDLALQLDGDAALELKQRRRLQVLFWLVLSLQILFILFLTGITALLFIVGLESGQWGLPLLGLVCLFGLYLQVSRTVGVIQKIWQKSSKQENQ